MKIVFKNFVVLAVCLSMLLGCNLTAFAAKTYQLSGVSVGQIFADGDIIYNDNNRLVMMHCGEPQGTMYSVGMFVGTGSTFEIGEGAPQESPYWEIGDIQISDFMFYEGNPVLNILMYPTEEAPVEEDPTEEATAGEYKCVNHDFEWTTNYEATETKDGMMSYSCKHCGHVADTVKISAYAKFLQNTTEAIKKAPAGSTVKIKTDLWVSFSKAVAAAMQANPGVAVEVQFVYDGHVFKIVIPAGYDLMAKMNKDGYAGFAYLATDPALNLQWIR